MARRARRKQLRALKFWTGFFALGAIILFAGYVFQISSMIAETYQAQNNEQKLKETIAENKNLEIQFSKINSLEGTGKLADVSRFERIEKIHHIQVLDGQVVVK